MELLKVDEFASRYNLSKSKVRAMCKAGELPSAKIGVGWRINVQEAEVVLFNLTSIKPSQKPTGERRGRVLKPIHKEKFDFMGELAKLRGQNG